MARLMKRSMFLAVVLLAGGRLLAAGQSALPGSPDPAFGPTHVWDSATGKPVSAAGIVTAPSFGREIGAIAVQNTGGGERIVALSTETGAWKLMRYRYTADGRGVESDPAFGTSGVVTKTMKGATVTADYILRQPDNKLLVVGHFSTQKRWTALVARYEENGRPDTSFGAAGTLVLAGYSSSRTPCLQPDGKLLLPVYTDGGNWSVIRLEGELGPSGEQAGRFDASFGTAGVATIMGGGEGSIEALAIQTITRESGTQEDMVVVSRTLFPNSPGSYHYIASLVRLHANGTPDGGFAGGGEAAMDVPAAEGVSFLRVAVDAAGRIVVGGSIRYQLESSAIEHVLVARYKADGSLDDSFGTDGVFTDASTAMSTDDLVLDASDRIMVSGWPWPHTRRGLGVWRLGEDGAPDQTFGSGGFMRTGTMWAGLSEASHVALVAGGTKLLVGGTAYVPQNSKIVNPVAAVGRFVY